MSVGIQTGYGGGTGTHAIVEHGFILIAVGTYQVFKQRKGFLRGVFVALVFGKVKNRSRIIGVFLQVGGLLIVIGAH